MPIIVDSSYYPPILLSNPHIQTVFPAIFRKVSGVQYERERIDTPDSDFLDTDWSRTGSDRVAILLHGLEGDSQRPYMLGMVKALNRNGWDAVSLNFRGCSGECNRQLKFYHSGETEDLETVIKYVIRKNLYSQLVLIGFSLGGNVVLKYLGERGRNIDRCIKAAVAISVPCDLASGAMKLAQPTNRIYLKRFLILLRRKIKMKNRIMPDAINDYGFDQIKNFEEYDNRYTAPIHGFRDAKDYWEKASSKPFLSHISVPTLLINAADDPFLADECFPFDEARRSSFFYLEVPKWGGHVGFVTFNHNGEYWSETRSLSFLNQSLSSGPIRTSFKPISA